MCERNERDKIHPCQSRKSKQPFARCPTPISKKCPAVDEMEAERFDQSLDKAAQSGKFDPWLKKVDADIDAGRVKPLNEVIDDA